MRKIYLETMTRQEALKLYLERSRIPLRVEEVLPAEALGRVTAGSIFARASLPNCSVSAMDGIAVRAEETYSAGDQKPVQLALGKNYLVVDTGDPLPAGFNAVIKIEDIHPLDNDVVEIIASAAPGQHVRSVGEDVVAGDVILPAFHRLTPPDLGVLLAGGYRTVQVLARPRIAVIPTGDELIGPAEQAARGQIVEFNGTVLSAYLSQWGAEPFLHRIVRDDADSLRNAVRECLAECDMVIVNAGSSAGRDDYTVHVLAELGEVLAHGVRTRPGKPAILGRIGDKPFLGVPGYPVSAYLALEWFARPMIYRYYRQPVPQRQVLKAKLGRRIISEMGSEEFIPVTMGNIGNNYLANPLNRGAGVTMSLVRAHGLLIVPANALGFEQGEEVDVELFRSEQELENTLMAVGSHDLALDILGTYIKKIDPLYFLSSSHLGSMGGIMAIKRGEAHFAGVHLLDTESGDYNTSYVERYLAGQDVVLVNLAYRMQGLMVEKGNPLHIKTVEDLAGKETVFVNRQKGAGTRLLLDFLLRQAGISPGEIRGYEREEYTHLNVAAAIAEGTAQAGLGVLSAAKAYDLDFVPVGEERYDLLMTRDFYQSEAGMTLLESMMMPEYKNEIEALGGYSLRDVGKVFEGNS